MLGHCQWINNSGSFGTCPIRMLPRIYMLAPLQQAVNVEKCVLVLTPHEITRCRGRTMCV